VAGWWTSRIFAALLGSSEERKNGGENHGNSHRKMRINRKNDGFFSWEIMGSMGDLQDPIDGGTLLWYYISG